MVGSDPAFSPERPEGHTHQDPRLLCFTLGNPDSMATETVGPKNTDLNFSSQAKGQGPRARSHAPCMAARTQHCSRVAIGAKPVGNGRESVCADWDISGKPLSL